MASLRPSFLHQPQQQLNTESQRRHVKVTYNSEKQHTRGRTAIQLNNSYRRWRFYATGKTVPDSRRHAASLALHFLLTNNIIGLPGFAEPKPTAFGRSTSKREAKAKAAARLIHKLYRYGRLPLDEESLSEQETNNLSQQPLTQSHRQLLLQMPVDLFQPYFTAHFVPYQDPRTAAPDHRLSLIDAFLSCKRDPAHAVLLKQITSMSPLGLDKNDSLRVLDHLSTVANQTSGAITSEINQIIRHSFACNNIDLLMASTHCSSRLNMLPIMRVNRA